MLSQSKASLRLQYIKLRYQCYQHQLKAMLTALGQFFYFLMMALYLALPAIFLSALISLSVIAAKDTSLIERIGYQWGYFLLVFLLIRIQRSAILGSQYRYYLKNLNYSAKLTKTTTVLLMVLAGNAPLLAPSLLVLLIPNIDILITQFYFVLFAISVLAIATLAMKRSIFFVLSLVIYPLSALVLTSIFTPTTPLFNLLSLTQTATILNFLWIATIVLDGCFFSSLGKFYNRIDTMFSFTYKNTVTFAGNHYWQLRLIELKQQLSANLARLFALVLITILVMIFQLKMHTLANIPVQLIISHLFAIIIASYHFDNEAFYRKYNYYLASLLITTKKRYFYDTLIIVLAAASMTIFSILVLKFSLFTLLILPLTTTLTVIAIHYFSRNFFILPSIFTLLLIVIYFML